MAKKQGSWSYVIYAIGCALIAAILGLIEELSPIWDWYWIPVGFFIGIGLNACSRYLDREIARNQEEFG